MPYVVYCHTNKINGKKYFGITGMKPERRWSNGYGYKTSRHFYFSIQKYGWDSFEHEIVESGLTKEQAAKMEQCLIEKHKTNQEEFGYNMSAGGESGAYGVKQSAETIEKRCQKIRGRKTSEETKRKLSEAAKGRTFSKETLEKMRLAKLGKPLSEQHKKNMSVARKGRTITEASKEKMREAKRCNFKPVYCLETDCVYSSIHEAARELNLFAENISAVCRGKHKHTKDYHFRYAEKEESDYVSILT